MESGGNDRLLVRCPACIQYLITGSALATVENWELSRKLLLAGRIRRYYSSTSRSLVVTTDILDSITGPEITDVSEKQNTLLVDIANRSAHPGAVLKLHALDCVVADALPGEELIFLLSSLVERDLLQNRPTIYDAVVTAKGWEYIQKLRSPMTGNRSDIFVAMPFSEEMRDTWESGIRPGITAAGFRAKRVDSDAHNDKIDDRIIAGIRACYATVVDVTTQNAGAYFEAGFAMGLGRPVVWTVRRDDLKNLHFDTRQFNHIVWDTPQDLSDKLTNHLLAVFGRGPVIAD